MKVEKVWEAHGLKCVVVAQKIGHRCGYVGVPKGHKLYKRKYTDRILDGIEVHGGITFSADDEKYPIKSDLWWFGFDCAHAGDAKDETIEEYRNSDLYKFNKGFGIDFGVVKTLGFCVHECESLAEQLQEIAGEETE